MKVAIDKNDDGIIDNIIEAESLEAAAALLPSDTVLDAVSEGVQIGWVKQENGTYAAPPPPRPVYKNLTRLEFVTLCRTAGGMVSPAAAVNDPDLADFWVIFQLAESIPKDSQDMAYGIAALDAQGHIPNGAQAVMDAWPYE